MSEALLVLLVLACPLMMILMMRGHRHGSHAGCRGSAPTESTDELRRRRDELDRLIAEREAPPAPSSTLDADYTPVGYIEETR